jgi:hypothetical protein
MVNYQIESKNRGALVAFMDALKSHDRRTGSYNPSNYDLDGKHLTVRGANPPVVEKLMKKYTCCKIIQL